MSNIIADLEAEINELESYLNDPEEEEGDKKLIRPAFDKKKAKLAELKSEKKEKTEVKSPPKKEKVAQVSTAKQPKKPTEKVGSQVKKSPSQKSEKPKKVSQKRKAATDNPSYRRKATSEELAGAEVVHLGCPLQAVKVTRRMEVEVKMTVNPGEYLLYHVDGHLFTPMTTGAFGSRCIKVKEGLASALPQKRKPSQREKPTTKKKGAKPAKGSCSATNKQKNEILKFNLPRPAENWLDGVVEAWKAGKYHAKVEKMYFIRETSRVMVQLVWYDPLVRRISLRFARSIVNPEYYHLCLSSGRLTKAQKPKNGTYNVIAGKTELGKLYSTKRNWAKCNELIRSAYNSCKDGNCSQADRAKYSKYYHECGDAVKKEKDRQFLRDLHAAARKVWNPDKEGYLVAYERAKAALEKSAK